MKAASRCAEDMWLGRSSYLENRMSNKLVWLGIVASDFFSRSSRLFLHAQWICVCSFIGIGIHYVL